MKERVMDATQKFSRAIIQPVMFLEVTGILLAIGVIMEMDVMPGFIKSIGDFIYNLMMNGGINQLSVIFCVGIATALANRKKVDAAILSISIYLIFLYANNAWLSSHGMLVDAAVLNGTGQAMVLGVQVVDMGVFLGIILGCLIGYLFNKFSDVEFPDIVRIYGGSRFAYLVCVVATVALAIVMCYVWPAVNGAISSCATFIENSGNFGLFIYGFLNRILIPTGMHHLIYMPFLFTAVGGTAEIGGQMVSGAQMIFSSELGQAATLTALDPSVKYLMFGFSKVFGCIGVVLAFIKTAHPDRKAEIKGLLIPALFVAVLAGITEPLEFMFMFVSPLLWVVHSVFDGLFQVIIFALGARFPFSGGIIASIPSMLALPVGLTKWYITFGVGIIAIAVWYFTFVFLIKKLNLKTPGREEGIEAASTTEGKSDSKAAKGQEGLGNIYDIIEGLGGRENILTVNNCFTRLRVEVKDVDKLDEAKINKFKNSGIVKKGNNIQIIIGMKVQSVREDVCQALGID